MAKTINTKVREFVDEYVMSDGRRLYVLGEGRLVNLAAAHGHPASVMDMSFAAQALATEWSVSAAGQARAHASTTSPRPSTSGSPR